MRYYMDASTALHVILPGGDPRGRAWFNATQEQRHHLSSSVLLGLEIVRALRRDGLPLHLVRRVTDRIDQISINDGVLRTAATIGPHVTSLDAIHLAPAGLLGSGVTVVTHDQSMAQVATDLGMDA